MKDNYDYCLCQEPFLARFCLVSRWITVVCYGKSNVTAARDHVSSTITITWPGCCWLSVLPARCLSSCVVLSHGERTPVNSAKALFLSARLQTMAVGQTGNDKTGNTYTWSGDSSTEVKSDQPSAVSIPEVKAE